MTTVADLGGEYTGFEGALTTSTGGALADVQFDCKWGWGDVDIPMGSGRRAKKQLPGSFKVTTKITKVFVHDEADVLLGYALNDTPITGTAGSRLSATTITAATVTPITTDPATPSRITLTISVAAITTAGTISVKGTDSNDNEIEELFVIPDDTPSTTVFTGSKVFKTTDYLTVYEVASTGGAKVAVDSLAGNASYTVGNPKVFDLVGTLTKGAKSITVTLPDCWFKTGGITWTDKNKTVDVSIDVGMYDPELFEADVVG